MSSRHRGEVRGIAWPVLDPGARRGWVVTAMPWSLCPRVGDLVPIVQATGWASGLVWIDPENLTSTGVHTPDHPAHSKLLYWLWYPTCISKWLYTVTLFLKCKNIYSFILQLWQTSLLILKFPPLNYSVGRTYHLVDPWHFWHYKDIFWVLQQDAVS